MEHIHQLALGFGATRCPPFSLQRTSGTALSFFVAFIFHLDALQVGELVKE